jgi:hypothetical protein
VLYSSGLRDYLNGPRVLQWSWDLPLGLKVISR